MKETTVSMKIALAGAALLALAACSRPAPPPAGKWAMQASATAGAALVYTENGQESLRIACRRNPADLLLVTPRLPGHAGPLRLRIGEEEFALVAADEPVVSATGPLSPSLPAALVSGQAISVQGGQGATAAFGAPDPAAARAFASACAQAAAGSGKAEVGQ